MKTFKIRASASGLVMTNPQKKTDLISQTTKSYVYDWLKEQIYGQQKEINSKYIDKGLQMEDDAILKAIEVLNLPFAFKNDEYFEDDYFTGTPDLILEDEVIDIKCSWDCFTFPLFETEIPNKNYFYQLQVYMHLTGKRKARLVYVLLNNEEDQYALIDDKYKVKSFDVEYDEDVIKDLQQRVENIREFVNQLNK